MAVLQPPPTWASPVIVDPSTKDGKFNPVWLKWFIDLVQVLNTSGGTAINHNDTGGLQGGQANQFFHLTTSQHTFLTDLDIETDRYTPTLTNVTNLDSSTAFPFQYIRVNDMVSVSGKVTVDPTAAATATEMGISLPFASDFTAQDECCGTAASVTIASECAAIRADTTNDRAAMRWITTTTASNNMFLQFLYIIL